MLLLSMLFAYWCLFMVETPAEHGLDKTNYTEVNILQLADVRMTESLDKSENIL